MGVVVGVRVHICTCVRTWVGGRASHLQGRDSEPSDRSKPHRMCLNTEGTTVCLACVYTDRIDTGRRRTQVEHRLLNTGQTQVEHRLNTNNNNAI